MKIIAKINPNKTSDDLLKRLGYNPKEVKQREIVFARDDSGDVMPCRGKHVRLVDWWDSTWPEFNPVEGVALVIPFKSARMGLGFKNMAVGNYRLSIGSSTIRFETDFPDRDLQHELGMQKRTANLGRLLNNDFVKYARKIALKSIPSEQALKDMKMIKLDADAELKDILGIDD
jgi:hypothetical protein